MSKGKTKLLIVGGEGQLGRALHQTSFDWGDLISLSHKELDITDRMAVNKAISDIKPDWIVNAAAYTTVDQAEIECDRAFRVNADGAAYLAEAATKHGAYLVQVSTEYVFDGYSSSPYRPDDDTNPLNIYGKSKLNGELRVLEILGERVLVLRTSWVYSMRGPSFLTTMLRLLSEKTQVRVVDDQIGTPTSAESLAQIILLGINKGLVGIHHWTDAGTASWYDFAYAIHDEALNLGLISNAAALQPIPTADYPTLSCRPSFGLLDKTVTRSALGFDGEHWRVVLRKHLAS